MSPDISGSTRLYAVIGDPIAQVQSPALLNPLLSDLGNDAVVIPVHARPDDLPQVVQGLQRIRNLDGMLITVPHKAEICRFADRQSPTVMLIGTANVMRRDSDGRWTAENFDGLGLIDGLEAAGYFVSGMRVSLIGAGGAGSAIAAALLGSGVVHLSVCDVDASRLAALLARLRPLWPGRLTGSPTPALAYADIVVNATPLGLRPADPLPFPVDSLRPGCLVVDIIAEPEQTALLRAAAERNHPVHHGIHMLRAQVGRYRDFFGLDRRRAGEWTADR